MLNDATCFKNIFIVTASELLEIKISDIHGADSINHASVIIHGKGRKQREVL